MIIAETAIGRKTKKSPVGAFAKFGNSILERGGGWINAIIPMLIVPYYSVIGGWVCRYLWGYLSGGGDAMALEGAFEGFLGSPAATVVCFLVFATMTMAVIFGGVRNGVIPITLILVAVCYLGGELWDAIFVNDNVSQLTHIIGGLCGGALGFGMFRNSRR